MRNSIATAPPNSFVAIADNIQTATLPDFDGPLGVAFTATCIFFGCRAEVDGDTIFTLDLEHRLNTVGRPILEHVIETPGRKVCIWTVELHKLLEQEVPTSRTRVRVWGNHPVSSSEVIIGLAEAD
jgi:hypothetical protein